MKITKKLKHASFEYDEELKEFTIKTTPHGESHQGYAVGSNTIKLNKIYAFAFMRFVVRMAQRNWLRATKKEAKILDKSLESVVELSNDLKCENIDHPNQMKLL